MPNRNYQAGRREEYATQRRWEARGYTTARSAGSHSPYDVIAIRYDRKPELIQCKVVQTQAHANRMVKKFRETTIPSLYFHQVLTIKIKGTKIPIEVTV